MISYPSGSVRAVRRLALLVRPDLHGQLHERVRLRPVLLQTAPANDGARLSGVAVIASRQADWTDVLELARNLRIQSD